ncbi:MAG: SDR family oxidoreductase [Chroococcidiopsidaceae cyanobacterium CP_BM_RX_35]|nr:SDR family oxidoreductase [Chroococcidiopsidaceae cyanobacterium CP_BM_RX_35]
MNVAIIGCGYIGTAVARHWQQLGMVVTATTTTPERVTALSAIAAHVVVVKGNDLVNLQLVVQDQDVVLLSVGAASPNVYEETYLHTAKTLVSLLKTSSVKQLIYTGSYAVYGDINGDWVDETSEVAPANSNGQILYDTEQVLLSASSPDRNVCILRLGGIYGPGRELEKIFGRVAGTTRPGKGNDATNWIHRDDIVAAIEFARTHRLQGIYNLVNDAYLTSRELLDKVCEQHQLPKVMWDEYLQSNRPYNARVSNQKIKDAGYQLIHIDFGF